MQGFLIAKLLALLSAANDIWRESDLVGRI
jgi:hypothetical protein